MINQSLDDLVVFVERPLSEQYALKILQGPYLGVIYTYGKVSLYEDEANVELRVKFNFTINEVPENLTKESLDNDTNFKNFMGEILTKLLEEKIDNDKSAKNNN